ncbi:MAG: HAD-IA family hydrolase [Thermoplasmata archaeon]|nr:HAD-IA family hydrolase [Thermoplasmata archaeon]
MGRLRAILFDLGDTLIKEIESPADLNTTDFEVLDGAVEVLSEMNKNYRMAIVSNTLTWGDKEVSDALAKKDLTKYFDAIVTSVDAGSNKPNKTIFKKALNILDAQPYEAVMIGDRIDTDISGANALGIISILYRWNDRYPVGIIHEEDLPDFIVGSLKELLPLIKWLDDVP